MCYEEHCPECGQKANFEPCERCDGTSFDGLYQRCVVCDGRGGIYECDFCWDEGFESNADEENL